MRRLYRLVGESGAGSILGLAILISCFAIFSLGSLLGQQLLGLARLQAQTDAIALAAADALRGISTGYPCIVAKDIAAINRVVLQRCRIVGFEVFIETSSSGNLTAKARAGPGEE